MMKIKVEPTFACSGNYVVQIQVQTGGKWINFGHMNYLEREELADQLKQMAKELLVVK
jgi:hypothetical protein